MAVVQNDFERFHGNRLVVERRDADFVQKELNGLGVTSHELASSQALQLTLLELPNLESEGPALLPHLPPELSAGRPEQAPGQAAESVSYLDLVLLRVRSSIQGNCDGWAPTMGKDQILDRIQGTPYIKGATGIPAPLPAPLSIPKASRQAGPRVAILDTALYAHPDLAGRYLGPSAENFGPAPADIQAHSTFIAGLIAQRAPTAELVVGAVLNEKGENASSWDVATQMVGFLDAGVAVLNLSLGCATSDRVPPLSLSRAVERLLPAIVVVAAAGNHGVLSTQAAREQLHTNTPMYPAAIDGVVGVGAYDPSDPHSSVFFNPNPPPLPWIELLAPGVRVQSTFLSGPVRRMFRDESGKLVALSTDPGPVNFGQPGYASWDGTSFAAANVSGEIAALMAGNHLSAYEALDRIRSGKGGDIFLAGLA
jgi:Subtilase family